ncbi:alkaline phosphatase [Thalassotalea sp. 1_MG-2023]|uniref:alkaline phosphatase n=1 Tax=Thalassotalea sp. 1_MG-2023 TaxID=3062680 RepID=UPI0026E3548B|nr:alkaline phosphatase [Thalassotalea sp. 1_MG-2023]MDO6428389.1 alkaline phosphatase [Thalassotalea sp. 1_MG-2023]
MKKLLLSLAVASFTLGCNATSETTKQPVTKTPVTNVIMIVADGMGPAFPTAYRYYADNPLTPNIEQTIFDKHLVGMSSTYPAQESGRVTDSAAGATALAAGVKTYNSAISVDVNKQPVETVLQRAKALGKKTGVVVTSQVNHATPAAYITHNESRKNYNAIADSYIDNGINVDVLLGGGWQYFIREDRNLVNEFKQAGFDYIDNFELLSQTNSHNKLLGLFADVGLPPALDNGGGKLLEMTKTALSHLENPNGFFMLVEASQVDWAAHSNDINSAMAEMHDLAQTLAYLESYVASNPNTQVVLTADHSTGGLTLAAKGEYRWSPEMLREMKTSTSAAAQALADSEITETSLSAALANITLENKDITNVIEAKEKALSKLQAYLQLTPEQQKKQRKPSVKYALYRALNSIIDHNTNTGWTTSGHTAVDVPVYAIGAQSAIFEGLIDNTDVAKGVFTLIEKN